MARRITKVAGPLYVANLLYKVVWWLYVAELLHKEAGRLYKAAGLLYLFARIGKEMCFPESRVSFLFFLFHRTVTLGLEVLMLLDLKFWSLAGCCRLRSSLGLHHLSRLWNQSVVFCTSAPTWIL